MREIVYFVLIDLLFSDSCILIRHKNRLNGHNIDTFHGAFLCDPLKVYDSGLSLTM